MPRTRQKQKPKPIGAGFEGRQYQTVAVRISPTRTEPRVVRTRPGDFHWRYNRDNANSALLHAGVEFASLWEKAGIAVVGTANLEGGGTVGWAGLPDRRTMALDKLRGMMTAIGMLSAARLNRYCVEGQTAGEIARQFGIPDRDMAAVLDMDLRAAAMHLKML